MGIFSHRYKQLSTTNRRIVREARPIFWWENQGALGARQYLLTVLRNDQSFKATIEATFAWIAGRIGADIVSDESVSSRDQTMHHFTVHRCDAGNTGAVFIPNPESAISTGKCFGIGSS